MTPKKANKMNAADRESLLHKFYIEYGNENYEEARKLLEIIIHQEKKKSFWLYSRLSSCYYELKDYEKAFSYAKIAYKLKPNSPLVLWDYAGVLIAIKKEKRAIQLLLRIQEMEDNLTIYGFPEPNLKWMRSLKNDINFQIGRAYYIICEDQLAKEYFSKYLSHRKQGLKTIYSKRQVLDYLKKLGTTSSG